MGQANTQVLHEAVDQLHPADVNQVLDFIGYLKEKRGTRLKADETEEERQAAIEQALEALIASDVASRFGDPLEWQREVRKDRPLPGRQL